MVGPKPKPLMERVWGKVDKRELKECWPWTGARSRGGYGMIGGGGGGARGYAHRLILEEQIGHPLAEGIEARHLCHHPWCCNPLHLVEGTSQENADDMVEAGRSRRGEKHWNARLTEEQVAAIRADPRSSTKTAADYDVSARTIRKIRQGTKWK